MAGLCLPEDGKFPLLSCNTCFLIFINMHNAAVADACVGPSHAESISLPWHLVNLQSWLINSPGLHTLCLNHTGKIPLSLVAAHIFPVPIPPWYNKGIACMRLQGSPMATSERCAGCS